MRLRHQESFHLINVNKRLKNDLKLANFLFEKSGSDLGTYIGSMHFCMFAEQKIKFRGQLLAFILCFVGRLFLITTLI